MARPIKKGLDYFTHDVATSNERAIRFIESKYGLVGYGIYFKILEKIYGEEGYFIHWKPVDECIYSSEWGVDVEFLRNLLSDFFEINLFSKLVYDANQVLTSPGIQRRYHEAAKKRPRYNGITCFCLINNSDSGVNHTETNQVEGVNDAESAQRKGKERKENQTPQECEKENRKRFKNPSTSDVAAYCQERGNSVDAETFVNFYEAKGWMVGKNKMKDWRAAVRTWEKNRTQEITPTIIPNQRKDEDEWQQIFSQT